MFSLHCDLSKTVAEVRHCEISNHPGSNLTSTKNYLCDLGHFIISKTGHLKAGT